MENNSKKIHMVKDLNQEKRKEYIAYTTVAIVALVGYSIIAYLMGELTSYLGVLAVAAGVFPVWLIVMVYTRFRR